MVPDYSKLITIFTDMIKKDYEFEWTKIYEKVFARAKEVFYITKALGIYDPEQEL